MTTTMLSPTPPPLDRKRQRLSPPPPPPRPHTIQRRNSNRDMAKPLPPPPPPRRESGRTPLSRTRSAPLPTPSYYTLPAIPKKKKNYSSYDTDDDDEDFIADISSPIPETSESVLHEEGMPRCHPLAEMTQQDKLHQELLLKQQSLRRKMIQQRRQRQQLQKQQQQQQQQQQSPPQRKRIPFRDAENPRKRPQRTSSRTFQKQPLVRTSSKNNKVNSAKMAQRRSRAETLMAWGSSFVSTTLVLGLLGIWLFTQSLNRMHLEGGRSFPFASVYHPLSSLLLKGSGISLVSLSVLQCIMAYQKMRSSKNSPSTKTGTQPPNPLLTFRVTTLYGMTALAVQQAWIAFVQQRRVANEMDFTATTTHLAICLGTAGFFWILAGYDAMEWTSEHGQSKPDSPSNIPLSLRTSPAWVAHDIQQRILKCLVCYWMVPMTILTIACPSWIIQYATQNNQETLSAADEDALRLAIRLFGLLQFEIDWVLVMEWMEDDATFAEKHAKREYGTSWSGWLVLWNVGFVGLPVLFAGTVESSGILLQLPWAAAAVIQTLVAAWTILALYYDQIAHQPVPTSNQHANDKRIAFPTQKSV